MLGTSFSLPARIGHSRHPGRDDNLQRLLLREPLPNQRIVVVLCERGEPIRTLGLGLTRSIPSIMASIIWPIIGPIIADVCAI